MTEKANTKLTKYTFDAEEVSKSFTPFRVKKEEVEKNLLELKVEDEISLNSAQMTFNRGKEIQDEIVKFSAELKAPFTETANRIQSYFNAFVSPLTKNLEIAGNKILNYKTMEAEKVKEAANKQLEDVSNEFKQNKDNFDKLEKLCVISVCRIFGGNAVVGGKETIFSQLNTVEAAQHMRKVFEQKFPNPDTFGKFAANAIMVKELAIQSINEIEIGLKGTGYDFNLGRIKLEEKFQVELKKEIKLLEKENKLQVKTIGKSVQSVMRGTRKTVDYELIDITKVPLTYLCLDEKKVDDYLATHREELKQMLTTHESVEAIKGVKFFNNVKVVKS